MQKLRRRLRLLSIFSLMGLLVSLSLSLFPEFFQFRIAIARLFVITTTAAARGADQSAAAVAPQLGVVVF